MEKIYHLFRSLWKSHSQKTSVCQKGRSAGEPPQIYKKELRKKVLNLGFQTAQTRKRL